MTLPVIIDIEASGFGRGSYPIEIGYYQPDGQSFCSLIRPDPAWTHWDDSAEQVHGIARPLLDIDGQRREREKEGDRGKEAFHISGGISLC